MKKVKHNGLSMSKLDIAKEIDFILNCGMTRIYGMLTYEQLRHRLFFVVQRYVPHLMCEFENLHE